VTKAVGLARLRPPKQNPEAEEQYSTSLFGFPKTLQAEEESDLGFE
jgi:hypothetical protein